MPHPHARNRLSPDDLARYLAGQLASAKPPGTRFELRNSVFVGRLIAGATVLATGAAILAAVLLGVDWWTDRSTAAEVLATGATVRIDRESSGLRTTGSEPLGIHAVQSFGEARGGAPIASTSSVLPQLPSPTTTLPVGLPGPSTNDQQNPSSSVGTPSTVVPTTTPSAESTTSTPTTTMPKVTSTQAPTTTTLPGTTTTLPTTTTTVSDTTTTCAGNSGNGNGRNCG